MKKSIYNFDPINNTLFITAGFKKAASKFGTPEYNIILQLRRDYPDMKIEHMNDPVKNTTACKLTYNQMKQFIGQCRDSEERMAIYNRVFALSQAQRSPYHYMKTWFLKNYANYSENPTFDDDHYVIVKTKAQVEAEKKETAAQSQVSEEQTLPVISTDSKALAA